MSIKIYDGATSSWKTVSFPYVRGEHYDGVTGQAWLPIHTVHVYDGDTGLWKEAFRNTDGNYVQQTPVTHTSVASYQVEQGVRFIKFQLKGASGGGGGGLKLYYRNDQYSSSGGHGDYGGHSYSTAYFWRNETGGNGGDGQQFDALIEVVPGETYTMTPGSAGTNGNPHDARAAYGTYTSSTLNVSFSGGAYPRTASVGASNGGNGGNTSVTGSARSIHIRAYGGDAGIGASGTVSASIATWYGSGGASDRRTAHPGSVSLTGPTNGAARTSDELLQGTQADGSAITKTNEVVVNGGAGGSGGNTDFSFSSPHAPVAGTAGTDGSVTITLYKKAP